MDFFLVYGGKGEKKGVLALLLTKGEEEKSVRGKERGGRGRRDNFPSSARKRNMR